MKIFNIKIIWKKLLLLLIISPVISIALIVILNELAWAFSSNEVSSIEVVEFFPTYMYQDPLSNNNEWNAKVSAVVYLPVEQDWLRKNVLSLIVTVTESFGFDGKITKNRFDTFFRDFKRGKMLNINFEKEEKFISEHHGDGDDHGQGHEEYEEEIMKDINVNIDSSSTSMMAMITNPFESSDNNQKHQKQQRPTMEEKLEQLQKGPTCQPPKDSKFNQIFKHQNLLNFRNSKNNNNNQNQLHHATIGPSTPGGIITDNINLKNIINMNENTNANTSGLWLSLSSTTRSIQPLHDLDINKVFLPAISPSGVSVISDIDDTIKVTGVGQITSVLRNSLLKSFEPVPYMANIYREWDRNNNNNNVHFHYVSSSPWPMANLLHDWITNPNKLYGPFPAGSMHLKAFRLEPFELWGVDTTALNIIKNPTNYKIQNIVNIFNNFPKRKFILVGDSSEMDLEIYAEISQLFPQQIACVFIRNVTTRPIYLNRIINAGFINNIKYNIKDDNNNSKDDTNNNDNNDGNSNDGKNDENNSNSSNKFRAFIDANELPSFDNILNGKC